MIIDLYSMYRHVSKSAVTLVGRSSETTMKTNRIGFTQFCQETSLHGWSFFVFGKFRLCHVIFWSLVLLSMIILVGLGIIQGSLGIIFPYLCNKCKVTHH